MKIKNYTTMKISETFCSLKTTATVLLLGVLLLTNTAVNAQNNALDFDGVNDYVTLPATINNQITTNNVTVEGWFYMEAIDAEVILIGEWYGGSDRNLKFALYHATSTDIVASFSNNGVNFPFVAFDRPALNTWVHFAATYDGANLRLYYNGVQKAVQAVVQPEFRSLPPTGNGLWALGKRTDAPGEFTGKMDEIRIWNVTRSAADILANYRSQVQATEPGLVAYYKMDQGVGGGNNAGITSLTNSSSVSSLDGTLIGPFALTGSTSNFVETGIPTVYNASAWSQGAPNATRDAFIEGNYSVATDLAAKTLTVSNNAVVTIPSGNNVTVTGAVTVTAPATLTFSNNANLIQDPATTTNSNVGVITVNRNSNALKRLDYTLWSSPVASQNLLAFSPLTSLAPNRFYIYNPASDKYTNTVPSTLDPNTTNFSPGVGYLIRMPNENPAILGTSSDYYLGNAAITYNGVFTGIPNNGDVPVALVDGGAGLRYNLVGNPYPSPITIATFVADNAANIEATLYFWRKTNGTGSAYCTYNTAGNFSTNNNAQSVDPAGVIQTGQGFFVEAKSGATSLTFKNGQRVANNANQFFKTKQLATPTRIWLNATTTTGGFSQMAVNYADGATQGVDDYDSKYINDSPFALTSNINNEEYTIQGRPSFVPSDVVALNFKTAKAGDYTIAIDRVDGLFLGNQDIYLVDSKTGIETDLKMGSYTFTAAAVVDNTRFSLKFQKTLSIESQEISDNSVIVYKNGGVIYVNSGAKMMNNIKVFDIQGRVVAEQKSVKTNTTSIQNLRASNQVLIVKVTTDDNQVISKKVEN
jgi:hypothetical protein